MSEHARLNVGRSQPSAPSHQHAFAQVTARANCSRHLKTDPVSAVGGQLSSGVDTNVCERPPALL